MHKKCITHYLNHSLQPICIEEQTHLKKKHTLKTVKNKNIAYIFSESSPPLSPN